jgi:predicted RNA binding protein YcfA (HicA-like mRNA interferase family)
MAMDSMSSREVIKLIEADGWIHKRTKGSHWIFAHPTKSGIVVVPHPKKDLPQGTLRNILKAAGLL